MYFDHRLQKYLWSWESSYRQILSVRVVVSLFGHLLRSIELAVRWFLQFFQRESRSSSWYRHLLCFLYCHGNMKSFSVLIFSRKCTSSPEMVTYPFKWLFWMSLTMVFRYYALNNDFLRKMAKFLRRKYTYANAGISTRFLTARPAAITSLL